MNFETADKVLATVQATDEAAYIQSNNRAKINQLFNGSPLLDDGDAKKIGLRVNCNFGEAPVLGQHGRRQYSTAFLSRQNFFTVRLPDAPTQKQADWSAFITRKINKALKSSLKYFELQRAKWAAVLLHGYAPTIYEDTFCTQPEFVALEDFRVPTDSRCDLSNLSWFAVRKPYTPGELAKKVFGKYSVHGWNKKEIGRILDTYKEQNWEPGEAKWSNEPEKLAEIYKQNGGFYAGDAVPTIPLFHFYYQDDRNPRRPEWRLRVVPDTTTLSVGTNDFLFDDGKTKVASEIGHILQMQFGDLNNKPPFLIHSVRSMGFLLMEPIFHANLLDCRFIQHVHEHMNPWLRVLDPQAKARAQKVDLYDKGIVPDGVTIVPAAERHQINPMLIEMAKDRMQQLKQEAAVSYTQDTEPGRKEDETATAVMARVSQVNAMMSGLLLTGRTYETFHVTEICRRFCLKGTNDRSAMDFQRAARKFGIPSVWLDPDLWDIEVDMPLGNGNPTMEMAQGQMLMAQRPAFDATAQQEILHEWTIAVTGDPRKAERWAPIGKQRGVTDAQEHAELAFSTLMLGVPVRQREGLPLIDQIETMLGLIAGVIARIEQTGNMATASEIAGLINAAQYTNGMIQKLGADKAQAPRAKQYAQTLSKLMNAVKGFQQRLAQAQKAAAKNGENGDNGAAEMMQTVAKVKGMAMQAATKAKISEANARQKMRHKDQAFVSEQKRKNLQTIGDEQRKNLLTQGEVERKRYVAFNSGSESDNE